MRGAANARILTNDVIGRSKQWARLLASTTALSHCPQQGLDVVTPLLRVEFQLCAHGIRRALAKVVIVILAWRICAFCRFPFRGTLRSACVS
eukprot:6182617-Pleurochrysis_carterae.AAC.3